MVVVPPKVVVLSLNYQELDIEENSTTVGWILTGDSEGVCDTFILQGFTLPTIESGDLTKQEFNVTIVDRYTAIIPSDEYYMNPAGDVILYRLIAVDKDETICSTTDTQMTYYRFDGKY